MPENDIKSLSGGKSWTITLSKQSWGCLEDTNINMLGIEAS